tara:strand:+ start:140 stop:394 length:255 start_codon:yes stop_codon:yes gene_type:complete
MRRVRDFLKSFKGPELTTVGSYWKRQTEEMKKTLKERGIRWYLIRIALLIPLLLMAFLLILSQSAFDPGPGCWGVCGMGTGWGG